MKQTTSKLLLLFALFCVSNVGTASPHRHYSSTGSTDYFRSNLGSGGSGGWSTASNWQSSSDGVSWVTATVAPTSNATSILIQANQTMTISGSSQTMNNVTIDGNLKFTSNSSKLTDDKTNGSIDIDAGGALIFQTGNETYANAISLASGVHIEIHTNGRITVGNNSNVAIGANFATDATGTYIWDDGSIFEWNNTNAFPVNVTYFPSAGATVKPIFLETNTATVGAASSITKFYGVFQSAAAFSWTNGGNINFRNGFVVNGDITFASGGSLTIGDYAGTSTMTASISGSAKLIGTSTVTLTNQTNCTTILAGNQLWNGVAFTNNGTLDASSGSFQIDGTGSSFSFTNAAGGTVKCGNTGGLKGTSGTLTNNVTSLSTSASTSVVNFDATANQTVNGLAYGGLTTSGTGTRLLNGDATISGTYTLGINLNINGKTLTITSSGTGMFIGSTTSNMTINGSAGTVYFDQTAGNNYIKNFTVNSSGSATIGNTLYITGGSNSNFGILTVNGSLNAAGNIILEALDAGSAIIGQSTGSITGNLTHEIYVRPVRAWRFFSFPFGSSGQKIRDALQEGVNNTCLTPYSTCDNNPNPHYGTHITGDNDASKGFDINTTTNPSLKVWDAANQVWSGDPNSSIPEPPTISTNLMGYDGMCIFVRGSRAVDLSQGVYAATDETTLRSTGTPNVGTVNRSYSGLAQDDIVLVGNPYASPIDILKTLNNTGSSNFAKKKFWVWDPGISGNYGVGGFIAYGDGTMAPLTKNYPSPTTILQSGQAAFLKILNSSGSLRFQETDKVTTESNVFGTSEKTTDTTADPLFHINLLRYTTDTTTELGDGVAVVFDSSFNNSVSSDDVTKVWNDLENMAIVRGTSRLAIEGRHFQTNHSLVDTIPLIIYGYQNANYNLQIIGSNFSTDSSSDPIFKLVDDYLGVTTTLSNTNVNNYSYSTTTDTNTYRHRFYLISAWSDHGPFGKAYHRLKYYPGSSPKGGLGNPDAVSPSKSIESQHKYGKEVAAPNLISLYPNPTSNMLDVSGLKRGDRIIAKDINGKICGIFTTSTDNSAKIDCSRFVAGTYFLEITSVNGTVRYAKFVKQ